MKYWNMEYWNGSSWVSDGKIPAASGGSPDGVLSMNVTKQKLVDGDKALVFSSTKYNREPIDFEWHHAIYTDDLKSKIETYIKNQYGVRITINSVVTFEGYFTDLNRIRNWPEDTVYDLAATFEYFDVDNSGSIND